MQGIFPILIALGEALSSEREPFGVLETLKLQLGSDAFSAQYQQAPAPPYVWKGLAKEMADEARKQRSVADASLSAWPSPAASSRPPKIENVCSQIVADRNRPLEHVQWAHIILFSVDRLPVLEVARCAGVSGPAVWRGQARYAGQRVEGCRATRRASPLELRFRPRSSPRLWT